MIRWFAKNDLASNLLMVCILVAGGIIAFTKVPLEVRPTREFPEVRITVPYRGGSPEEIERQIVIPIEQALQDISGVDTMKSVSSQGSGKITLHMKDGVDPKKKLVDIERRVRSVRSLPSGTDTIRFNIPDTANYFEVISVAIQADNPSYPLQKLTQDAYDLRNALLALPEVKRAQVIGTSPREFAIRLDPEKLKTYQLTFDRISSAIKNNSQEVGAGTLNYEAGRLALRPGTSALSGADFKNIPIPVGGGETVKLSDIAEVNDGFSEQRKEVSYLGKPALLVEIFQTREQSAIEVANAVKEFVKQREEQKGNSPINLYTWDDESFQIEGRLKTLSTSLLQGGILVLVVLGLFLRPTLAFWVVIGIPLSFAGGVIFMPIFGITGNMMSIFAFILVLGIVVDDAIVTGENIYDHLQKGTNSLDAAVKGTHEVTTPVVFGVLTTIVAFIPLYNFDGWWGILARQIPPIVAPVLLFSLIESKLILPSHLKHINLSSSRTAWYNVLPDWFNARLQAFTERAIKPLVLLCMKHRYTTLAVFITIGLSCLGYWQSGRMGFQVFPTVDTFKVRCVLRMETETQYSDTKKNVERIYNAILQLKEEFKDGTDHNTSPSLIQGIVTSSGGHYAWGYNEHSGYLIFEIMPMEERSHNFATNTEIVNRLRELCGEFPNAKSFYIRAQMSGRRGADDPDPIEVSVRGKITPENEEVLEKVEEIIRSEIPKSELESIHSNLPHRQDQLSITLNEEGHRLGLTENSLARQIKSSIIGTEIARLPRPTGEIKVLLMLPETIRQDRFALDTLMVSLGSGNVVPLASIANINISKTPSRINRVDGASITNVVASPKDKNYDLVQFADKLTPKLNALFQEYPNLNWAFEGYLADYKEIRQRFLIGIIALSLTLFVLLALPFNSMIQPFYVMTAVPFGIIGAFIGHLIMDITPSYLSMFGVLALSGVVVNDSLVLVDTINRLHRSGTELHTAIITAITRRFRPILLTSLTTFAGLLPLMFAKSLQAQFLIPMAVSLGYGILFATFVTLLLVPAILLVTQDVKDRIRDIKRWFIKPFSHKHKAQ